MRLSAAGKSPLPSNVVSLGKLQPNLHRIGRAILSPLAARQHGGLLFAIAKRRQGRIDRVPIDVAQHVERRQQRQLVPRVAEVREDTAIRLHEAKRGRVEQIDLVGRLVENAAEPLRQVFVPSCVFCGALAQHVGHRIEVRGQTTQLVVSRHAGIRRQIAARYARDGGFQVRNGLVDAMPNQPDREAE
jgi:hypothetical protein